jgi:hypothetical protein
LIQLIRIIDDLPDGLPALLADAASEGVGNMARLADGWASGDQRFDGDGEALLGALLAGELAGIGGLSVEPAAPSRPAACAASTSAPPSAARAWRGPWPRP